MKVISPDLRFRPGRVLSLGIVLLMVSCSSLWKAKEKVVIQHDTTTVHHRDSIYQRDSIYIREWTKGDTVYIDRWHDRLVWRDRWRDSIQVKERIDSVSVPVPVERELTLWQKARINSFWWLVLAVALLGAWTFRKPILKLLKTILK